MMSNILNTDPILSVPNATAVPNVNTVLNRTENDQEQSLCAKSPLSVPSGVMYQPVYQTLRVPKCTKLTKTHYE